MKFIKLLFLITLMFSSVYPKIRILTFHYNRPDFIGIQHKTLDKFLKDDYELIVFNDAPTVELSNAIQAECDKWNIKCVRFEQHWHEKTFLTDEIERWQKLEGITGFRELGLLKGRHPSVRHCHVIQYALDNYGYNHDDIVGILDGDMFPIRPISVRNYLKQYDIVATTNMDETRSVEFLWVGICFFNVPKLPNIKTLKFHLSLIGNRVTDSGGHSYYYLKENPAVRVKKHHKKNFSFYKRYDNTHLKKIGFSGPEISIIRNSRYDLEFHLDCNFLHYSRSSFVNHLNPYAPETDTFHENKSSVLNNFVNSILKN